MIARRQQQAGPWDSGHFPACRFTAAIGSPQSPRRLVGTTAANGGTVPGSSSLMASCGHGRAGTARPQRCDPPTSSKARDYVRFGRSCRASTGTTVRYCRASGEGLVILLSVHELVDDLCKKAASLCAGGGNAGDCGGVTCPYRASTWENAIHILCMKERRALSTSRTAMSDK